MNLQQLILKRAKLRKSFCSYKFKLLKSSKKSLIVKLQRSHNYLQVNSQLCSTAFASTRSVSLQTSRLKTGSNARENTQTSKKEKESIQNRLYQIKFQSDKQISKNNKQTVGSTNKMNQYLQDYYSLKFGGQTKTNKFQILPSNFNSINKYDSPGCNKSQKKAQLGKTKKKLDDETHQQINNIMVFNPKQFPEIFYDFSLYENKIQDPFKVFRILNIKNKKYIEKELYQMPFTELPIKDCYHKLNEFSVQLEQNIFYISLSKQKTGLSQNCYSEGFFWISRPIKHHERNHVLNCILKFLQECLKLLQMGLQNFMGHKIWIIDFHGRISYINRKRLSEYIGEKHDEIYQKQDQVNGKDINQICLSMFLSSLKRGLFNNQSTINDKSSDHTLELKVNISKSNS